MTSKVKTSIVILITLLIGIAIGFQVSEILIKQRFEEFRAARKPGGLTNIFLDILKPDDDQKKKIVPILNSYNNRFDLIMQHGRGEMDKLMDSLKIELTPFLSKEQIRIMNEEHKKIKKGPPVPPGMKPPGGQPIK